MYVDAAIFKLNSTGEKFNVFLCQSDTYFWKILINRGSLKSLLYIIKNMAIFYLIKKYFISSVISIPFMFRFQINDKFAVNIVIGSLTVRLFVIQVYCNLPSMHWALMHLSDIKWQPILDWSTAFCR